MSKKLVSLFLAVLMLFSMACAETSLTDMYGRTLTLEAPVTRIVALTAADCEILCALGCEDALVGRGAYCDWPESILDVPVVQSGMETNIEEILALQPQVVLMGDMAQSKTMVEQLEQSGIQVAVSNAETIEGAYTAIRMIGQLMGKQAEAETMVADMQAAFAEISQKAGHTGKTVYFEVSPLQYGLWAAGKGSFLDELAALCGLTNAFADGDAWAAISEEQVLARDPDYIVTITPYGGEGPTPAEEIMSRPGWGNLKAVRNGQVFCADPNTTSRPGPRLVDAALELYGFTADEAAQ